MDALLLRPQGQLSNADALRLAQVAPEILRSNPRAFSSSPLQGLFSAPETSELWTVYENLLLLCLRTGNERAAHECLDRIVLRFGATDERCMALQGIIQEAEAKTDEDLNKVLKEYDDFLKDNDSCVPVAKRRVALLRSIGKTPEAITALNSLLEFSPTDAEAWAELADLYLSEGLYAQAIYALEEVLVLTPNAWNIHARLGEVSLMAATTISEGTPQKHLAEALKRFSRSIELCDDYLRGYYGLKLVTDKLLETTSGKSKKQNEDDGFVLPDQKTIQKLNELATKKLGEIVRRHGAKERLWQGYSESEITAARELIEKSTAAVVR